MRFLIPLIFLACSGSPVGTDLLESAPVEVLHGDMDFSAREREEIQAGNDWMARRVHREPVQIVWDLPHTTNTNVHKAVVRHKPGDLLGFFNGWTSSVWLDPSLPELSTVSAHEFGHYYGCAHQDSEPGVMNPSNPILHWSHADYAACGY